jgi:transposase
MAEMTFITGPERRRQWNEEERQRIVDAAFAPGAVVAKVARQFDIATSLIYKWRRQGQGELGPAFAPAMVIEGGGIAHGGASEVVATPPPIQVEFSGGTRVSIEANAPSALVLAVLRSLR